MRSLRKLETKLCRPCERSNESSSILSICKSISFVCIAHHRYALGGTDDDWDAALAKGKAPNEGMVVSVKSGKDKKRKGETVKDVLEEYDRSQEKQKKKKHRH